MPGKKCGRNLKSKKQTISRSTRTQLHFPVSRVAHLLRQGPYSQRLNPLTSVYLAAILEYLTASILDLAGQEAHRNRRMYITPEHVKKVLEKNMQLCCLFKNNTKSCGLMKFHKSKK